MNDQGKPDAEALLGEAVRPFIGMAFDERTRSALIATIDNVLHGQSRLPAENGRDYEIIVPPPWTPGGRVDEDDFPSHLRRNRSTPIAFKFKTAAGRAFLVDAGLRDDFPDEPAAAGKPDDGGSITANIGGVDIPGVKAIEDDAGPAFPVGVAAPGPIGHATGTITSMVKPEHPAPWRWSTDVYPNGDQFGDGRGPQDNRFVLLDANGDEVAGTDGDDWSWIDCPSPLSRELIRLAPELERWLRELLRPSDCCPSCAEWKFQPHGGDCEIAALLATLDAARKAPR